MPNPSPTTLPENLESAHALIRELDEMLRQKATEVEQLKNRIDQLCRRLFGRSSEKVDPRQLRLAFEELEKEESLEEPIVEVDNPPPTRSRRGHARRRRFEDLPRERVINDLAEKSCEDCQRDLVKIGEDVSEKLDYVPSSVVIRETVTPKYACPSCHDGVLRAPGLPQAIERGIAGPGLLAYVVTSKYADHLPLHRLERILRRQGVEISRSTMCDWVAAASEALEPIWDELRRQVVTSDLVQSDDTPVTVLDPKVGQYRGYFWGYRNVRDGTTVFDFTEGRSREGPNTFLAGFAGHLQTDAYSGYSELWSRPNIVAVGCWSHARRKVHESLTSDAKRSSRLLAQVRRLYDVEKATSALTVEERLAARQTQSRPILEEIAALCDVYREEVVPKSPLGEALGYMTNQWKSLVRYTEDGRIPIDNNPMERELRSIAIGRKNWLFAGSPEGGRRAAILFTIMACCRREKLDPFIYLRDVLVRVATHPASQVAELTPATWKTRIHPQLTSAA